MANWQYQDFHVQREQLRRMTNYDGSQQRQTLQQQQLQNKYWEYVLMRFQPNSQNDPYYFIDIGL